MPYGFQRRTKLSQDPSSGKKPSLRTPAMPWSVRHQLPSKRCMLGLCLDWTLAVQPREGFHSWGEGEKEKAGFLSLNLSPRKMLHKSKAHRGRSQPHLHCIQVFSVTPILKFLEAHPKGPVSPPSPSLVKSKTRASSGIPQ